MRVTVKHQILLHAKFSRMVKGFLSQKDEMAIFKLLEAEKLVQNLWTAKQWCLLGLRQIDLRKSSVRKTGEIGWSGMTADASVANRCERYYETGRNDVAGI